MAEVHTRKVTLYLFRHDDDSAAAHAVLSTRAGTLTGRGRARRAPAGGRAPDAGQDVAAARALRDLADQLLGPTDEDVDDVRDERGPRPATPTH